MPCTEDDGGTLTSWKRPLKCDVIEVRLLREGFKNYNLVALMYSSTFCQAGDVVSWFLKLLIKKNKKARENSHTADLQVSACIGV